MPPSDPTDVFSLSELEEFQAKVRAEEAGAEPTEETVELRRQVNDLAAVAHPGDQGVAIEQVAADRRRAELGDSRGRGVGAGQGADLGAGGGESRDHGAADKAGAASYENGHWGSFVTW